MAVVLPPIGIRATELSKTMDDTPGPAALIRRARAGELTQSELTDPRRRALLLSARAETVGVQDVAEALRDLDARVRRQACEIAARRPDLAVDLVPLLADAEPLVAEAAAFALGERPVSEAELAALIASAGGADHALVREAAVAALGAIGDQRGLDAVLAAMDDVVTVRRRAVLALAPFGGAAVDAALAAAAADRDWQVRHAARDVSG